MDTPDRALEKSQMVIIKLTGKMEKINKECALKQQKLL